MNKRKYWQTLQRYYEKHIYRIPVVQELRLQDCSEEKPILFFKVHCLGGKIGIWCSVNGHTIIGRIFYEGKLFMHVIFMKLLLDSAMNWHAVYFEQDSATAHTADASIVELSCIFGGQIVSKKMWPPQSPDLIACDFYLWGRLMQLTHTP